MRCKKNITSNLQNITPYFTGKAKIITLCFRNITLSLLILILSLVNITLCFSNYNNTSALSYQSSADVKFTFNPTLSINISPSDLIIDNLTPGTNNDSNVINVSVATNASHGYTLSATVGDSLHNNTNLTHTNGTNTFDSIATNSSLSSLTTDNTWGYSYKLSNNTTWNNYSGLSNETSKTLISTDSQTTKPIDFKIAAKASSTQPSGTYTNTINFIAISKPIPKTIEDIVYMQTFGELLPTDLQSVKDSMILNQDYTLKDSRDEKEYYVTRLEDGNVWMTQNLDLCIGCSGTEILTSENTDLNDSGNGAYSDGYAINDGKITWTPVDAAITSSHPISNNTVTDWVNDYFIPYSAEGGDVYVYASNTTNNDTVYNSESACITAEHTANECRHYHIGNYYNWIAAIASNSAGWSTATNSICPSGWELPINASDNTAPAKDRQFAQLFYAANIIDGLTDTTYVSNGFNKLRTSPLFFVRGGYVNSNGFVVRRSQDGMYWSGTFGYGNSVYAIFNSSSIRSNAQTDRSYGLPVRCLAK